MGAKDAVCTAHPETSLALRQSLLLLGDLLLAGDGGLEGSAGSEPRHRGGGNLKFLACLRIAADAGGPLGGLEGTEANQWL